MDTLRVRKSVCPFGNQGELRGVLCCVSTLPVMAFLRMPRGKDDPKTLGELGELGANPFRSGGRDSRKGRKG